LYELISDVVTINTFLSMNINGRATGWVLQTTVVLCAKKLLHNKHMLPACSSSTWHRPSLGSTAAPAHSGVVPVWAPVTPTITMHIMEQSRFGLLCNYNAHPVTTIS